MIFLRPLAAKVRVYRKETASQGSITIFASLSLLLIASFLLALLEAARVTGMEAYSRMNRINAMESVFSEYDADIFEQYGIFMLDGSYGSGSLDFAQINGRLQSVSQKNLRPVSTSNGLQQTQNFYQMDVADASVTGYLLATDHNGAPFRKMAVDSMKASYPAELAKKLFEDVQSADQAIRQANESQAVMETAQHDIAEAKERQAREAAKEAAAGKATGVQTNVNTPETVENPLDLIKTLKETDILTLVVPAGTSVSAKEIPEWEPLEQRELVKGNEPFKEEDDLYDLILYQQFLQTHFSCYKPGKTLENALDYELEYIQIGKKSDRENLKGVVRQLILLREGANYLYLQTDATKQQEAYAVATAIAAATGIAPATGLIAQAVLAAWAYVESILDVRTLLSGGKIAWMKTAESWSSSLSGLGALLTERMQAKEQPEGEDYRGYLQKLLYLKSARTLNYRAMDLIELHAAAGGKDKLRMDTMILSMRADFSFEAEPLFSEMVTLTRLQAEQWVFAGSEYYSYFTKE